MKKLYLFCPDTLGTIRPEVYGHFSEHIGGVFYDGLWVGEDSKIPNIRGFRKALVEKFKAINPPVLRWPGGCFAETYDWQDGIGKERPTRINWWTNFDGRYEPNTVGTHEFADFCEMVGAKPYFAANMTTMTPMDILRWMDYCLSPRGTTTLAKEREKNGRPEPIGVAYWGIGNENWGGGGNMLPEVYANEFRRYSTVLSSASKNLSLIACGPNGPDYHWTQKVMEGLVNSEKHLTGYSVHYYCGAAGDPLTFTTEEWYQQLRQANRMEEILLRHWNIIKGFGMEDCSGLVVDEWGCWHPDGSGPSKGYNLFEQQSTMRDAVVAALTLNIFNNNCDKVMMANVAQLVNNLHCLFLAGGEGFTVTPTYHVFDLYKNHQGGRAVRTLVTENEVFEDSLSVSASEKDGVMTITAANLSAEKEAVFTLEAVGEAFGGEGKAALLAHDDLHAHNTFENPETVQPVYYDLDLSAPVSIPRGGILSIEVKMK